MKLKQWLEIITYGEQMANRKNMQNLLHGCFLTVLLHLSRQAF